ncbi:MAG: GNAT family N-acetyltransferase [Anaerolineae bacterium]|jgi:N-acetylglutamate synthase-like GNAT family acetyltransferase|nr:GNAT family N-acetyltransferase [Anaerolineae bacterium]
MMTINPPTVTIRTGTSADTQALIEFIKPFVEDGKLLPRTFDELDELMQHFFIAVVDGEIVGCAALEIYSSKLAEIRSLAVSDKHQGLGIGRKLVDACIKLAQDEHILEVMAITSTEDFFIACGFDFTLPGEKKALFFQTR